MQFKLENINNSLFRPVVSSYSALNHTYSKFNCDFVLYDLELKMAEDLLKDFF